MSINLLHQLVVRRFILLAIAVVLFLGGWAYLQPMFTDGMGSDLATHAIPAIAEGHEGGFGGG